LRVNTTLPAPIKVILGIKHSYIAVLFESY